MNIKQLLPLTLIAVLAGCTEKKHCDDPSHNFRAYKIIDAETGEKIMGFGGQPRSCDTTYIHDTVYLPCRHPRTVTVISNNQTGGVTADVINAY